MDGFKVRGQSIHTAIQNDPGRQSGNMESLTALYICLILSPSLTIDIFPSRFAAELALRGPQEGSALKEDARWRMGAVISFDKFMRMRLNGGNSQLTASADQIIIINLYYDTATILELLHSTTLLIQWMTLLCCSYVAYLLFTNARPSFS